MGWTTHFFKSAAQTAIVGGLLSLPASLVGTATPATAQSVSISSEFRTAVETCKSQSLSKRCIQVPGQLAPGERCNKRAWA